MIQISHRRYINKDQIISIVDDFDNYVILMANGEKFYVYSSDWDYYRNIQKIIRGE